MPDYKQEMKKLLGQNSLTKKEIKIQQIYYSLSDDGKESIDKVINDVKNEADELRNFTESITNQRDDIGKQYREKLGQIKDTFEFDIRQREGTIKEIIRAEKKEAEYSKQWDDIKESLNLDDDKKKMTLHEFMGSLIEEKESLNQKHNDELMEKYKKETDPAKKPEYMKQSMNSLYRDYTEVPTFKKLSDKSNAESTEEIERIDELVGNIVEYYTSVYRVVNGEKDKDAYDIYKKAVKNRDEALVKAKQDRDNSLANIEGADKFEEKKEELKGKNYLKQDLQEYKDSIIPKIESGSPGALSQDAKKSGLDLLAAARAEYRNNCSWWDRLWANILSPERFSKAAYVAKINAYKEALKETGVNDKEIADADPDKNGLYVKENEKYVSVASKTIEAETINSINNLMDEPEEPIYEEKKENNKVRVSEKNKSIAKDTGAQDINKGQKSKEVAKTTEVEKTKNQVVNNQKK
ncbi:MAG: hypothetical protein MJ068_05270 [Clostridia bacterium]|nr:hypothetical protein [Clostridia bacterium]